MRFVDFRKIPNQTEPLFLNRTNLGKSEPIQH